MVSQVAGTNPAIEFKETRAYKLIKRFIFEIDNDMRLNKFNMQPQRCIVDEIDDIVENTPLSAIQGRYANPAMVQVIERIEEITDNIYLRNSFGNKIRMDFGTGHELNFLCYLYCQVKEGKNFEYSSLKIYLIKYFRLIRKYVKKFNVEAAGSRGCWSIDDYQLLPYIFGSAGNFLDDYSEENMFKEAQKNNSSLMLSKICTLPQSVIHTKLLIMYDEEVLGKKVVTQHFIYSEYLPSTSVEDYSSGNGNV